MAKPLTPERQALLVQYHRARVAWEASDWTAYDSHAGTAYWAALDACLAVGIDPFHHPTPQ